MAAMEASENTRRESAFTTTNRAWGDSLIMIVILAVCRVVPSAAWVAELFSGDGAEELSTAGPAGG